MLILFIFIPSSSAPTTLHGLCLVPIQMRYRDLSFSSSETTKLETDTTEIDALVGERRIRPV